MKSLMKSSDFIQFLDAEKIKTWFDLGLFIDRVRENRKIPAKVFDGDYEQFSEHLSNGNMAFLSFYYSIDGVTIEADKYAQSFEKQFPGIKIHFLAGNIKKEAKAILTGDYKFKQIPEADGFDKWSLYKSFFQTKLQRGSTEYNQLIGDFWAQTKRIAKNLAQYIEKSKIDLLYLINTNSNPGNVSLSLAIILVSEYMGIPVINNNHDFYWEGGASLIDIETGKQKNGPRDFFFTNYHLGEFFTIIQVCFPWEARHWMNININKEQSEHLILNDGHNPFNVREIGTAIDIEKFNKISKGRKEEAFFQLRQIFSRYSKTLITYSTQDVLSTGLVSEKNPRPILIGAKTRRIEEFISENIVFLQPTRIVGRKRIEVSFRLIEKLLKYDRFVHRFIENPGLKLTILVSGPIPSGQYGYFLELIKRFKILLEALPDFVRLNVFLGFTFGETDKKIFKQKNPNPIGLTELYSISSLILLPSKTEGRGLPIIEAAAAGVPIFCRRYSPQKVYSAVIGEHLPEDMRLKVIEFEHVKIKNSHLKAISNQVFFPHFATDDIEHNQKVVRKRYSMESLQNDLSEIIQRLHLQLSNNSQNADLTCTTFNEYLKFTQQSSKNYQKLFPWQNRMPIAGNGQLLFMHYLKSLIDPSFFRIEEQNTRGMIFDVAEHLFLSDTSSSDYSEEKIQRFYNAIDNVFYYKDGEFSIRHDHALPYRHRNKNKYPYQELTFQELTGFVNKLYIQIFEPTYKHVLIKNLPFFTDWNLALSQLTGSSKIRIDDRKKLEKRLKANVPIAYFPGKYTKSELDFFVLKSIRIRLNLPVNKRLTNSIIDNYKSSLAPIYIFAQESNLAKWPRVNEIIEYVESGADEELKLLYEHKILKIVPTSQLSIGIHFNQLGEEALAKLVAIKNKNGFIISTRRNSAFTSDLIDIDRFHIGRVTTCFGAELMGLKKEDGYIQFVPAGIRPTLAFPTPIQTAKEFSELLKSELYKELCIEYGERNVLAHIKKQSESHGDTVKNILLNMNRLFSDGNAIESSSVIGLFDDGMPYQGVISIVNSEKKGKKMNFEIVSSPAGKPKRVTDFIEEFEEQQNKKVSIAWNGGYILNPELVGKLGLPETYIGSPLGLLIKNGQTLALPLFNKPAFIIYPNGKVDIKRVNSSQGLTISSQSGKIVLKPENYNAFDTNSSHDFIYFDLWHNNKQIATNGRTVVQLVGTTIKAIRQTTKDEKIELLPVGLTFMVKPEALPTDWELDKTLDIKLNEYPKMLHAVEAGPLLLDNGEFCLDMEVEAWTNDFSIATQAARLDFTDMRGPKIAVGVRNDGSFAVLTINGRIRESVGATHIDMANLMKKHGMIKAMGFDPGGSSTLVVNGKNMNISPYNSRYEYSIYALPPEARGVANAVLCYFEE